MNRRTTDVRLFCVSLSVRASVVSDRPPHGDAHNRARCLGASWGTPTLNSFSPLMQAGFALLLGIVCSVCGPVHHAYAADPVPTIDATTLHHKVLCGYQGWFRCPDDPSGRGWVHWSRDRKQITPQSLTIEMWPDMREYTSGEKYPAPGFTYPDGRPAELFSSANPLTVDRHFDWMRQYEIDGALVQRFVSGTGHPDSTRVLRHAAAAAQETGRVFAVEYDMSGVPEDQLLTRITTDWKALVDEMKITENPQYLHHEGLPVLGVWGFFPERFSSETAHALIDFFKAEGPYQVTLIGGCNWPWRNESDPQWARALRRFDVLSPWNVGHVHREAGKLYADTGRWAGDREEAQRHGMGYMPVVFPGFSWDNLKHQPAGTTDIPRLGGEFYWRQFETAGELQIEMVKVAMFDEVDEATAIFKVSDTPPTQAHFLGLEGLPSDTYLRLTGKGSRLIRGE
ncbi:glycoside hydrolase family 71/99-like protein [Allorhodopirellula heiligendammensis]|uniref:Xylosidase/arabinosidase n=1 Tax=Allorhodopirellula heiligendammensis TaxID=2714739 RepID=A0A5C6C372_9BACT|nr:glycoside hydrolase family 71/99-like protein [Allorhodopirellula heiligendammensis]TWU17966.1 hypothetical protein Poly21_01180 [Allorhodopirellula heiligendammensis]